MTLKELKEIDKDLYMQVKERLHNSVQLGDIWVKIDKNKLKKGNNKQ